MSTPRRLRVSTICSASTSGTLVSLAPCITISGVRTRSSLWIGDRSCSSWRWVFGSPYSPVETAPIHGVLCEKKVSKLTIPNRFTAAAKVSGNSVTPTMVA